MKPILYRLRFLGALAIMIAPPAYAQTGPGTFAECVAGFSDLLDTFSANVTAVNTTDCYVNKGTAHVYAAGTSGADGWVLYAGFYRYRGTKRCEGYFRRNQEDAVWLLNYDLRGHDTAQWNKYVKGAACDDVRALTD